MAHAKLLSVREVAAILGITEREVMDLAEKDLLKTLRVGSGYPRFRHEDVARLKKLGEFSESARRSTFKDTVFDFIYFNDFYILTFMIIAGLLYIILRQ